MLCTLIRATYDYAPGPARRRCQHQPLIHTLSRTLKCLSIAHTLEDGVHFLADREFRMDIVTSTVEFRDASIPAYCHKGILTDGTLADPQEGAIHLRKESADAY